MNTDLEGDWLGKLMDSANKNTSPKPAQSAVTPTAPATPVPAYVHEQGNNYEPFIGKYFMIDAIMRECYFAWRNGTRDNFWLRASDADHQLGFIFDSEPIERQRLLNALVAGEDVGELGNLNTKPR